MKYTVQEGDSLSQIAQRFGYQDIDLIYNHADNADFKKKRPNPDIIHAGDEIFLPEIKPASFEVKANKKHTFVIKRPKLTLTLKIRLEDDDENLPSNKNAVLVIDDVEHSITTDGNGLAVWKIKQTQTRNALVKLFIDPNQSEPTHIFKVNIGDLNPVSEMTGIQARLNNLGFYYGRVDNQPKEKTETAVRAFQKANGLNVDGQAGPTTQKALEDQYGC